MIITFINLSGQPIKNATVTIVDSPLPHSDIAMITDDNGEIDVDVPVSGRYQFAIFDQNNSLSGEANLDRDRPLARVQAGY